jgi:hypothetical protein
MADDDITVASTTDDAVDVEAAAAVTPQELAAGLAPAPQTQDDESDDGPSEDRDRAGKGGFQKRIDRLTREKYQNLDRIQQLEERLRQVDASRSRTPPDAEAEERGATDVPGESTTDEIARRTEDGQRRPALEEARAQEAREREAQQVHARFARDYDVALPNGSPERAQLEEAAARTQAEVGGINTGVAHLVMAMPNSIDVYAHLCTHPDDLRVLNASRSHEEALANVRYVSGVLRGMVQAQQAQPATKPRPVKRAPSPIDPIRGGTSSAGSLDDADYQTFKRARENQEKNRYRY